MQVGGSPHSINALFADYRTTLTPRQRTIYNYIAAQSKTRGYAPTIREIGRYMGIKSPNGVACHLKALEQKGFIVKAKGLARAITVV
jgi:repressor LexA